MSLKRKFNKEETLPTISEENEEVIKKRKISKNKETSKEMMQRKIQEKLQEPKEKLIYDVYFLIIKECLRKCKDYKEFDKYRFVNKMFAEAVKKYERKYLMFSLEMKACDISEIRRIIHIELFNKISACEYIGITKKDIRFEKICVTQLVKKGDCKKNCLKINNIDEYNPYCGCIRERDIIGKSMYTNNKLEMQGIEYIQTRVYEQLTEGQKIWVEVGERKDEWYKEKWQRNDCIRYTVSYKRMENMKEEGYDKEKYPGNNYIISFRNKELYYNNKERRERFRSPTELEEIGEGIDSEIQYISSEEELNNAM